MSNTPYAELADALAAHEQWPTILTDAIEAGLREYWGHCGWSDGIFETGAQYVAKAISDAGLIVGNQP